MYTCYVLLWVAVYAHIGTKHRLFASAASVDFSTSYDCWQKSTTPVSCSEQTNPDILLPHPGDCRLFYHCLHRDLPPVCRKCPYYQYFDPIELVCTLPSEAGCQLVSNTAINGSTFRNDNSHNREKRLSNDNDEWSLVHEMNDETLSTLDLFRRSKRKANKEGKGVRMPANNSMTSYDPASANNTADFYKSLDMLFDFQYDEPQDDSKVLRADYSFLDKENDETNYDESFGYVDYYEEAEEFIKDPFMFRDARFYGNGTYFIKVFAAKPNYEVKYWHKNNLIHKTIPIPMTGGVRVIQLDFRHFLHLYNSSARAIPLTRFYVPFFMYKDKCWQPAWVGPQLCYDFCSLMLPCYAMAYIYKGRVNQTINNETKTWQKDDSRGIPLFYITKAKHTPRYIEYDYIDPTSEWLFNYSTKPVYGRGTGPIFAPVTVAENITDEEFRSVKRKYTIINDIPYDIYGPFVKHVYMADVNIINESDYNNLFKIKSGNNYFKEKFEEVRMWRKNVHDYKKEMVFNIRVFKFAAGEVKRIIMSLAKWYNWINLL